MNEETKKPMKKIASFTVDHTRLKAGLYLSRRDEYRGMAATTFDLRLTSPNREPTLDSAAMHTIEHIGATFFRNSELSERVVYFGPMGCKTGFYLVLFGDSSPNEILPTVIKAFEFIAGFEGEIPGATMKECGNYSFQNLPAAREAAARYAETLKNSPETRYPE